MMAEYQRVSHGFGPVYNENSKILILGSFPSVKSREEGFYYGHPRNRFWRVIAEIFEETEPRNVQEKRELLLRHGIALYDVIESCDIIGSSDSSIKNAVVSDLCVILSASKIRAVFTNGKTADRLYRKYQEKETGHIAVCLPSTSPANAAFSLEKLVEIWKAAIKSAD